MEQRLLGRTGLQVSPLCLGTMMFGPWGNDDRADAVRVIHHALDAGVNFVDTADVYSGGISEEIVGEALKGRRDDVVLATKFFMPMDARPNHSGGSRKWIMREVEASLTRLQTDYIDLYQVHRPSPLMDVEETLGALTDLVRQGKVRYLGSSSYAGSQIVEAQQASRERHLERFVTEQPPYSILVRGIEADVLPTTLRHGMGTLTYSPLAGGWLSGRWRKEGAGTPTSSARPPARFDMDLPENQRKLDVVEELALLAEQAGLTLIELAIAFVLRHPGVTSAIIGPRTMEQLVSQLPAADVSLSDDVLDRIDALVPPRRHDQPRGQQLRRLRADAGRPSALTDVRGGPRRRAIDRPDVRPPGRMAAPAERLLALEKSARSRTRADFPRSSRCVLGGGRGKPELSAAQRCEGRATRSRGAARPDFRSPGRMAA